jgi:hypothetical protein
MLRVMPSTATDPRQLAAELRERINPAYANSIGTESWERKLCADTIDGLIAQRDELIAYLTTIAYTGLSADEASEHAAEAIAKVNP